MVFTGQVGGTSNTNAGTSSTLTEEVFHSLLRRLNNGNKAEHEAVKSSLINFFTTDPINSTDVLMKYRLKQPKLPTEAVAVLLNAVESVVSTSNEIPKDALEEFLIFALEELTASIEEDSRVQKPALDILVALGCRHDCKMVMEALMAHTKKGIIQNALVFECFSKLAEANGTGVLPFIKSVLPTLYPFLGKINVDRLRTAKVLAIRSFCKALLKQASDIPNSEQDSSQKSKKENESITNCKTEIYAAYDSLFKQWLYSHNPEVSVDILHALGAVGNLFDEKEKYSTQPENRKSSKLVSATRKPRERVIPPKSLRYSDLTAKSKDFYKSLSSHRMSGAARKRMSFFIGKGFNRDEAKFKALRPMNERESQSRQKTR